jgi:hypothetical protein
MSKPRLRLDDLVVASFDTGPAAVLSFLSSNNPTAETFCEICPDSHSGDSWCPRQTGLAA